jgi:hypothetical protein
MHGRAPVRERAAPVEVRARDRRRGPCSIGPGPSRCTSGWRPRSETFEARGFSGLRAGFVLRDESSRRRRSRAPHGSGRAAPEHDADSPALGTRPPPLGVVRSTNCARISEEPDAGRRARVADRLASDHLPRLRPVTLHEHVGVPRERNRRRTTDAGATQAEPRPGVPLGSGLTGAIPAEAADPRRDQVAAPARRPDPRVSRSIQVRASAILFVVGAWRSLVAHLNGVQEVERSNRSAPTISHARKRPSVHRRGPRDFGI